MSGSHTEGKPVPDAAPGLGLPASDLLSFVLEEPGTNLVLLDTSGNTVWVSPAATTFLLTTAGLVPQKGQHFSDCLLPEAATAFDAAFIHARHNEVRDTTLSFTDQSNWRVRMRGVASNAFKGVMLCFREKVDAPDGLFPLQWDMALQRMNQQEDAAILVDLQLFIRMFTPEAARGMEIVLGKKIELGRNILDFAVVPGNTRYLEELFQLVFSGKAQERQLVCELPGSEVHLLLRYLPVFGADGSIAGSLILATKLPEDPAGQVQPATVVGHRWQFALEDTQSGIWDWDMGKDQVFYSDAWYRMMGYAPGEIGTSLKDYEQLLHPEDIEPMRKHRVLHANSPAHSYDSEYRLRHGQGHYLWIHARGMIIDREENGRPLRMVGTHVNITHRKLAEEKYRVLFHKNPLAMWTFDRETLRFLDVNEAAVAQYGYSPEEFKQLTILDIRPKEDQALVMQNIVQNGNSPINASAVWQHLKKDGSSLWVNITGFSFWEGHRSITLITAEDVTQKRLAEEELRASSERFKYVMNATNDIVWDMNIHEGQILWSDHYKDVLGWYLPPGNTLPWKHTVDCLHPDDRERVLESLEHALQSPTETSWENAFRYRRQDGSFAYVLEKAFILRNAEGKAYRMIGAMQDITEQQYQQEVQELELRIFALSSKPDTSMQIVLENIAGGLEQLHKHLRVAIVIFPDRNSEQTIGLRLPVGVQNWINSFARSNKDKWLKSPLRKGLTTHSLELADRKLLMAEWKGFEAKQLLSLPAVDNEGNLIASLQVFIGNDRGLLHAEWNALYRMQNLMRVLVLHHQALEQIRLANERFDNVMQATHDLIWDWNITTGSYYRSPEALRRLYGIEPGLVAANVHDWLGRIHPDDRAKVMEVIDKILADNKNDTFDVEYRFHRDDGNDVFLQDRGVIIRDESGKPLRMIGAAQDISERKRLEAELLEQELDRQRLISQATIDTQEQERAEIGRELHDNVNQVLTTTKLYLEMAQNNADLKDELIQKASANIILVINEIRQLSRSLMDPSIGDLGLIASIRDLIGNINLTRKMRIRFSCDEALDNLLDESRKVTIFRIVQEAMSNIIRHAKATEVVVKLKQSGDAVLLHVSDNGIGFDPNGIKSGIGLKNIRNRVYLVKGNLQIIAAPGKGCTLKIHIPIH
ncbi:PAS domain S-box-containing protein [Cnuella takakiae]|uniref:histidine kinase n=1 Tax=Cnuella takakiae TaxID=1302690 RepID=A0A1M4Y8D4_9BACT|nr:PAS domain-containing protein [Cnuella takakiae]SHF01985.1 PAS domain S-box-containing protein [Cnuella takakiae]